MSGVFFFFFYFLFTEFVHALTTQSIAKHVNFLIFVTNKLLHGVKLHFLIGLIITVSSSCGSHALNPFLSQAGVAGWECLCPKEEQEYYSRS